MRPCIIWLSVAIVGCALPRERRETLGASETERVPEAGARAPLAGGAPAVVGPSASPSSSATSVRDAAGGGGAAVPASTADAGVPGATDAGAEDACGAELFDCLVRRPGDLDSCARMHCRALIPVMPSVADAGTTELAACAMLLGNCLAAHPQGTAECMAMYDKCMR